MQVTWEAIKQKGNDPVKIFSIKVEAYLIVFTLIIVALFFMFRVNGCHRPRSFFEAMNEQRNIDIRKWNRCEILIPRESMNVFLGIKQSHPFLAEFDREIIFCDPPSSEIDIPINSDTGGMTQLKVFWFSDGNQAYLKLSDAQDGWCVIDATAKKLAFSSVLLTGNSFFNSDYMEKAKSYENVSWKYIGMVKYDRPDYEENLVFEPYGQSPIKNENPKEQ